MNENRTNYEENISFHVDSTHDENCLLLSARFFFFEFIYVSLKIESQLLSQAVFWENHMEWIDATGKIHKEK